MVSLLYANGVNGEDLATLTEEILVKEFRMTDLAARKVSRARHFGLGCDRWSLKNKIRGCISHLSEGGGRPIGSVFFVSAHLLLYIMNNY